jgi:hypothetical protein
MIVEVRTLLEDEMRESRALPQTPVTCSHVKAPVQDLVRCAQPCVASLSRHPLDGPVLPACLKCIQTEPLAGEVANDARAFAIVSKAVKFPFLR